MEALSVESVREDNQGMIERIGRNHPTDTSANDLDQEFGSEEGSRSRSWSGVSGLVALLLSSGVLFLAWLAIWERSHPAAAAARGIRSEQVEARLKAVHELENLGAEDTEVAIPALIVGLSDSEAAVRAASAQGLVTVISGAARTESGGMDVRDAVKALLESLDDPDPPVRSACTQALWMIVISWHGPLGLIDFGSIDDAMAKRAGDPDPGVRYSAICGLGMIGPRISDEAPEALIAALEDESPKNRITAANYLLHFPRQITGMIPNLVKSLETSQPAFRASYAEILGKIRPPAFSSSAIPGLMTALGSPDAEVRFLAASCLAEFRDNAREMVPGLLAALKRRERAPGAASETSRDPVIAVVNALGRLAPGGPDAEESVAALEGLLHADAAGRRAAAALALGGFRRDDALILALTESLRDRDAPVRVASLRALNNLAMNSRFPASKALADALDDESSDVRVNAASTLARVGLGIDPFIPSLLRHAEHDPDAQVREACCTTLEELVPPAVTVAAVPDLIFALSSRDATVRGSAAVILDHIGPPARSAIPALIQALRQPMPENGPPTIGRPMLSQIVNRRSMGFQVMGPQTRLIRTTRAEHSIRIVEALGRIAPGSAMAGESIATLLEALSPEEPELNVVASKAIGQFGPAAAAAVPKLLETLRRAVVDRNVWLAASAGAAVGRIAPDDPSSSEAIAVLLRLLSPSPGDGLIHLKAAEGLREFGPAAAAAIPGLIELLSQGSSPSRSMAAGALGRIAPGTSQDDQALAALTESLRAEPDLQITCEVIDAIAGFGLKAVVAIPRLKALVQSPNAQVSRAAQRALDALKVIP